jgi:AraC-like DNA-binding protein
MVKIMKNTPKPSHIHQKDFPFDYSISHGVDYGFKSLHWHKEMEICFIKSGTGKHLINGKEYSFKAGDCFIISNDEIHLCYDDENLVMQIIMFHPDFIWQGNSNFFDYEYLRPFFETDCNFCNKIDGTHKYAYLIGEVFNEIEQEFFERKKRFELMIKSLLLKLMTYIIRYFTQVEFPDFEQTVSKNSTKQIKEVIEYIEQNFEKPMTLNILAGVGSMSIPHLSSTFKTLVGVPPIDFIIRTRISVSKKLLLETTQPILFISEECGFRSLSNFNRLFKLYVGMTPREYRKS